MPVIILHVLLVGALINLLDSTSTLKSTHICTRSLKLEDVVHAAVRLKCFLLANIALYSLSSLTSHSTSKSLQQKHN